MKYTKSVIEESKAYLLEILKPGDTIYTVLNHVSRSGMKRSITPYVIANGAPRYITFYACIMLGEKRDAYDGVPMTGCGTDMGFELVYRLSAHLFPNGYGLEMTKKPCSDSKDRITPKTKAEAAKLFALGYRSFGRNGDASGWDDCGGYALKQKWL